MSEDITESYRSSLDDLKMNSKPQISMLTMLAEDHEQFASDIVRVIEEQIKKVPVARKLPIMYLIDSIIKNLSATLYPQLFAQCIVQIFCGVFEEVDEKTRQAMYKLRQTWPDIIPNKQLYLLDRKVQLIDPAWPITAKAPEIGVIHVNPKFLKPKEKDERNPQLSERSPQFSPVHSDSSIDEAIREELYAKEKELQKLRLELELAETKAKLEQQKKQLELQAAQKPNKNLLDRVPPPVIQLPPASSPPASTHNVSRDPRLSRDPRISRDPRLKKQQERQEQERTDIEKDRPDVILPEVTKPFVDVTKIGGLPSGVRAAPIDSAHSASSRMDLATLLNSFSSAAAKVAAEQTRKKTKVPHEAELDAAPDSPEHQSQRKPPVVQSKSAELVSEKVESNIHDKNSPRQQKIVQKSDRKNVENEKTKESKDISPKTRDKKMDDKYSKREIKKWNQSRDKPNSKDREQVDNKVTDRRDSKEKDRRDSKDKDRRDSKDLDLSRDRRGSREKRSDADVNHHNARKPYHGRSPDFRHGSFRDVRQHRKRGRDRDIHGDVVIHSMDGKTDQFGRMLRSKSGSSSRDRSPVDRDMERVSISPKGDNYEKDKPSKENVPEIDVTKEGITKSEPVHVDGLEKSEVNDSNGSYTLPVPAPARSEDDPKVESGVSKDEEKSLLKEEDCIESKSDDMDLDEESNEEIVSNIQTQTIPTKEDTTQSILNSSEDVDMRIQQAVKIKKEDQNDSVEVKHPEKASDALPETGESQAAKLKRPYSDSSEPSFDVRHYKIPKLVPKKFEAKTSGNQEDLSKLFGEEDVDYRNQNLAPPVQPPVSTPNQNLVSSPALNVKSPAQRRWSQFKESHPDDFAQDMERKRLRDAQMQSLSTDVHDVDLRLLTSSRQRSLPLPPFETHVPIPKDLSAENQEQILQRAEQELKEGRISHGDHQEIVRQLGQVYDIQKKRQNFEERPSRTLDLRDPRLRGIRETRSSYPEDTDRRVHYLGDGDSRRRGSSRSHLPGPPISADISDEQSNNSPRYRERHDSYKPGFEMSPNEDYDARRLVHARPRHDHRMEYDRHRESVDEFENRSPRDDSTKQHSVRDYDDRVHPRYHDYDARPHQREVDRFDEMPARDFDARHPRIDEVDHHKYRGENRRGPFDEFEGSHIRGPPLRGEIPQHDVRAPSMREDRKDEIRSIRHNSPPSEAPFRGPADDVEGLRPFGPVAPHNREPFINPGPRHVPVQDIGPPQSFPTPLVRPEQRMPVPNGPMPLAPVSGPPLPLKPGPVHQTSRISDPMDDPRWSAMKGLLDSDGTEELVIDGKPFELRMGTSRKLRIYGKFMDVAVDLKERGIRVDGQLVYKLGEPIQEVPAIGRTVRLYYHGLPKPIWLDGQQHEMRMDAPPRNVMVDGIRRGFQIDGRDMMILVDRLEKGPYGGPPRKIRIAGIDHDIAFQAPPRRILIDNKSCELKLDSRIPYVVIDGKPHGIRFDGEPRTVFINEQPFTIPVDRAEKIRIGNRPTYLAFGGPAHEIIIDGKWFEVKFDNVPKDIHLGNRHFSVRIPGPLPRVKILDELPHDFDVSRLMSSNQAMTPQPGQPQHVGQGLSEAGIPGSMPVSGPFLHGLDSSKGPDGIHPQVNPIPDSMHKQEPAGPEGIHISPHQGPDTIHKIIQPGPVNIRPSITTSEGNLRPIGPLNPENMRFGPPLPPQMIHQPNQNIIPQPGVNPMLHQQNQLRLGQNPMVGMQRPNLIGLAGLTHALQNPRMLQNAPPPVNLFAQGLLNQVASNMMNSTLQNLPDFTASLRALSQLSAVQQQSQQQSQQQQQTQPPHLYPSTDIDHGAAMVTGMQGSSFVGNQKLQSVMPPGINVPLIPATTISQPMSTPLSLPDFAGLQGIAIPPAVTTAAPSSIPVTTQPAPTSAAPTMDIDNLLSKLIKVGLIKEPPKSETQAPEKVTPVPQPEVVPGLDQEEPKIKPQKVVSLPELSDFDSDKLKQTHKSVIEQLHEGIQCHTCAARFTMSDHEKYRAHLDWHFRQNKIEQEMVKVAKNRKWFYSIPDWIQYEELEDTAEKSRSEIFEQMRGGEDQPSGAAQTIFVRALEGKEVIKNPVATGIEGEDMCATCADPFDQMWNEETEEWILKNAIKVDGKTYHPVCYEDTQETPTPVAVPTKNPLETQLEGISNSGVPKVEIKSEPMEVAEETVATPEVQAAGVTIKTEPNTDDPAELKQSSPSPSSDKDNNIKVATTTADIPGICDSGALVASTSSAPEVPCQGPTLLSTIATTVVREVIPVSQEDPMSPWEMDSNPTPELSRTPTPEPIPSFTPAPSLSSESISSLAQGSDGLSSEEPLPASLLPASSANQRATTTKVTENAA